MIAAAQTASVVTGTRAEAILRPRSRWTSRIATDPEPRDGLQDGVTY